MISLSSYNLPRYFIVSPEHWMITTGRQISMQEAICYIIAKCLSNYVSRIQLHVAVNASIQLKLMWGLYDCSVGNLGFILYQGYKMEGANWLPKKCPEISTPVPWYTCMLKFHHRPKSTCWGDEIFLLKVFSGNKFLLWIKQIIFSYRYTSNPEFYEL